MVTKRHVHMHNMLHASIIIYIARCLLCTQCMCSGEFKGVYVAMQGCWPIHVLCSGQMGNRPLVIYNRINKFNLLSVELMLCNASVYLHASIWHEIHIRRAYSTSVN